MAKKKKMTKAEKLQAEQEREAKTGIRVRYYPRSFLWNLLAVTLAFLFGIFASLAGLFGVGLFYASKATPKDFFGDRYADYIKEEYIEMSLLDLAAELLDAVREIASAGGEFTLNTIAKFTPILENLLNPMSESLSDMGITLDVNEFLNMPLSGMGGFFQEQLIYPAVLGQALGLTPDSNAIMVAICYGEEGIDYDVVDGEIVMREGKSPMTLGDLINSDESLIDRVTVEDAFSVTASSNAALRYLAYGTEGTHYKIEDGEIVMLRNQYTGELFRKKRLMELNADGADNAKISDLVSFGDNPSGLLKAIKDWKVSDLKHQSRINRLKIGQVVSIDDTSSLLMQAIADWRIEDLSDQNHIDSLCLGDVLAITESSPKLLRALETTAIGELGDKINSLRLSDILPEEDIAGNKILCNLGMSTLDSLADDIQKLSVAQVFGNNIYSYVAGGNGTYLEMLKAYDEGKNGETGAIPKPVAATDIKTNYSRDGVTLTAGWFCLEDELYRLVDESEVYRITTAEGDTTTVSYFTERRLPVTATYEYRLVNYASDTLEKLPESAFGTDTAGYADGTIEREDGEAVLRNGAPLYYYTERVKPVEIDENDPEELPEESEPLPPETEAVAYPLLRDDHGVFYLYLSEEGIIERMDFEEIAVSYSVAEGTLEPVTDENDKPVYGKALYTDGGATAEVRLYHGGDYDYILVRDDVEQRYFNPDNASVTYPVDDPYINVFYTASWTDADSGQAHENEPVDRFLHGFWYVMFGGEETDSDGNLVAIDRSGLEILSIDKEVTGATAVMSDFPLWKLYFHGIVSENPYYALANNPNGFTNLNEMTISEAIIFFKNTLGALNG